MRKKATTQEYERLKIKPFQNDANVFYGTNLKRYEQFDCFIFVTKKVKKKNRNKSKGKITQK